MVPELRRLANSGRDHGRPQDEVPKAYGGRKRPEVEIEGVGPPMRTPDLALGFRPGRKILQRRDPSKSLLESRSIQKPNET